jgi:hypothetical protein
MNKKELFYISITIFLTIVAWVIIDAYKINLATQAEKEDLSLIRKKIDLDVSVLKTLKEKKPYELQ